MKSRFVLLLAITIVSLLALTILVTAQELEYAAVNEASTTNVIPISVNINIGAEPTLDPALATDSGSLQAVEQLFIGLYDIDDVTAEAVPELVSNKSVSADGLVYTFTLRTDAFWSDGKPPVAWKRDAPRCWSSAFRKYGNTFS